jgi:hypothetical protein
LVKIAPEKLSTKKDALKKILGGVFKGEKA